MDIYEKIKLIISDNDTLEEINRLADAYISQYVTISFEGFITYLRDYAEWSENNGFVSAGYYAIANDLSDNNN